MRHALRCVITLLLVALPGTAAAESSLTSVGSDTLGELMQSWAQAYAIVDPGTRLQIRTPGSAAAPAALATGAADLGPMSRAMNPGELAEYRARRGREPGRIRVAYDAVAVFVHPDNALPSLRLADIARIWTEGSDCAGVPARRWSDLGIDAVALAQRPLLRLGRNTASGTFEFFHDAALCNGSYRADVVQFPGAGAIVAAVAEMPDAIGYAGLGHVNGLVRVLPLQRDGEAPVMPDSASVISGRYPLTRPLYLYFNRADDGRPDPATAGFLRFALGAKAQEIAAARGFVALPAADVSLESEQLQ
ncbi:MAG TPA: PstS family phosphate ABC transporter substrate-binding protein [Tahibacter sp.]|uniref:PstS family phosphate ABC transporter substrate-binding protein n=1 Tax=Tahibacter sp. TaxID=2056211 RepID=UPI002CBED981|nr:PstS family phosphate ABC transporter substrate-binding protein [Tahibacter sp.]HSX61193.1 PstS family phosphate ABC transporter substrate-binding protein [Tahibacter sp.]